MVQIISKKIVLLESQANQAALKDSKIFKGFNMKKILQRQPAETVCRDTNREYDFKRLKEFKRIRKSTKEFKRIQKNSKESKRIQKNPKESKRFQKNPNDSNKFQKNQKYLNRF